MLSGDSHHYARYAAQDGAQKITAGGGGAFTHLTHNLPEKLSISVYPDGRDPVLHDRKACYPDQVTSRRLLWSCPALGLRNPKFLSVPAGLAAFLLWANQAARTDTQALRLEPATAAPTFSELATGLVASPIMIGVVLIVVALLIGFAKPPARFAGTARLIIKAVMGILHGMAQLVAVVAVSLVVLRVPLGPGTGGGLSLFKLIVQAVLGGVAGSVVLGTYLAICNSLPRRFHTHDREASSCLRPERWKNFVRLHIDPQGRLTMYPIGIDEVCHDWRPNPDAPDRSAPRYVPAHDLRPRIIDGPVVISDPAVLATGSSSGVGA
jgi:hypothetical protein